MKKRYKLSYTASEIDERLGIINQVSEDIKSVENDIGNISKDIVNISEDIENLTKDFNNGKAHASQHSSGGSDPILPENIGAMQNIPVTDSDNGKFLCVVNGDWAAVTATIGEGGGVTVAEKATRDGDGNVIVDTYETKVDATEKLKEAKAYADDAIEAAFANIARAENMTF